MNALLIPVTLVITGLVVLALVVYLTAIAVALHKTRQNVSNIADGLEAVAGHTEPLRDRLTTINGALVSLLAGLRTADGHVTRAARVFRLTP